MTLFQNLILFTNRYGNLQEMLEMASFLKYVDLYLTSEWGPFYVEHLYYYIIKAFWGVTYSLSYYYLLRFLCHTLCTKIMLPINVYQNIIVYHKVQSSQGNWEKKKAKQTMEWH
jgi:hypothetical protein